MNPLFDIRCSPFYKSTDEHPGFGITFHPQQQNESRFQKVMFFIQLNDVSLDSGSRLYVQDVEAYEWWQNKSPVLAV